MISKTLVGVVGFAIGCAAVALGDPATRPATQPAATKPAATQAAATQPAKGAPAEVAKPPQAVRRVGVNINNRAEQMKAQREAQRRSIQTWPDAGTVKIDELFRFSVQDGKIQAQWAGSTKFANGQMKRFKVEGSNCVWACNAFNNGQHAFYTVTCYDFDAPENEFWMVTLSLQPMQNNLSMHAQGSGEVQNANFSQHQNGVSAHLMGFENNQFRQILTANTPDIQQLRLRHPDEFRRYILPMFRKVTCQPLFKPGPGDVYRVFTSIPADSAMLARIEALLPGLGADSAAQRAKAIKALYALGGSAALGALRIDPGTLLPEQASRLAEFVAYHSRLGIDSPAKSAKDPFFLLECLDDDDVAVRASAKAALESLLGGKLAFDVNMPADKRAAAIDALRKKNQESLRKLEPEAAPKPNADPNVPAVQGIAVPQVIFNKE